MKNKYGFTLIELIIVLLIISATAALIMPNLWNTGERILISEAKRVGNTLRYVNNESQSRRDTYAVKIDLDNNMWEFSSKRESRRFIMKGNISFKDIVVPSAGTITAGEVTIEFGPLGAEEPIFLHLTLRDTDYTVIFNHINGKARVLKGYVL